MSDFLKGSDKSKNSFFVILDSMSIKHKAGGEKKSNRLWVYNGGYLYLNFIKMYGIYLKYHTLDFCAAFFCLKGAEI